ncbi:TonB C-terminal domain-containing protein [Paracoccus pacificus]|uniref:TonB C-terminal domain-containing protein n=1 Tax=Paracoccus pacificus TaxID=1463598 RepID=A0ABW4R695_9RHOB
MIRDLPRVMFWCAMAALIASVHVALALWAMQQEAAALPVPADAVEIELALAPGLPEAPAAIPVAPGTAQPKNSTDAARGPEPMPEPAADFQPPPIAPLPPPDMAQLLPAPPIPLPDPVLPPLVPLPPPDFASLAPAVRHPPPPRPERIAARARQDRPDPEARAQPAPRQEPRRQPTRDDRRDAAERRETPERAQAQTRTGHQTATARAAASAAPSGGAGNARRNAGMTAASWQRIAGARVSAHMSRTRVGGASGTLRAVVDVSVSSSGATSARLVQGTGDSRSDSALARQATRMPKLPPPPNGQSVNFQQPIVIRLR